MGLLAALAWWLAALLGAVAGYALLSYLLLARVHLPDEDPYRVLEDARFVLVLPFVLAVVLWPLVRR